MIDNEIDKIIENNILENTGILSDLEKYAKDNNIPIIDRESANLLSLLVSIKEPSNILEIGTAIGYSSILMAKAYSGSNIITIERDEIMVNKANKNIKSANLSDRISIYKGDALDIINELSGEFDFVFIDGAKGQYKKFFMEIDRLISAGSVVISDNVLFRDLDLSDKNKRFKTIINRMKDYIYYINSLDNYKTSIIKSGDGLALSLKLF